jgi:hypothetical protein
MLKIRKSPETKTPITNPMARVEKVIIQGPVGALESLLEIPQDGAARAAVICHPHPLYHGTMTNKVVHTLARTFRRLGAATLRFNFRGVGASAGLYDEGRGEIQDALAAAAYMREKFPGARLWMAGFSFGGVVALQAAALADASLLVTVAPAVHRLEYSETMNPGCPWLLIHGEADTTVNCEENMKWLAQLDTPPEIFIAKGCGHFFHGKLNLLRDTVTEKLLEMGVA